MPSGNAAQSSIVCYGVITEPQTCLEGNALPFVSETVHTQLVVNY